MRLPWRYWLHRLKGWLAARSILYEAYRSPRRDELCAYNPRGVDFWDRGRWGWRWAREFTYWWVNKSPVQVWVRAYHEWGWDVWRAADHPMHRWYWRLFRASLNWTNWVHGGTVWKWPWQPRTCSYDGGVHPEDAIRLLREGWEVDGTTKSYKRYLEPPRVASKTFAEAYPHVFAGMCEAHKVNAELEDVPVYPWHPVPPVKVYVQHFNEDQIRRFNAVLDARRPLVGRMH